MSATTRASRIDAHTWLIDAGLYGLAGAAAVYLVQGNERSCLVDAGPRVDAAAYPGPIVRALERLHLFPPDMVILTHAHHDHAHGVPALRRAAARQGRRMEVLASWQALPLLEDAGCNQPQGSGEFEGISGVTPVREGDRLDLGGIDLRVCEVPGHCTEHIALLDETNGNLFAGDALGLRLGPGCTLPSFMPPSWDPDSFCQSVERLKGLGAHRLCLTHFGPLAGEEARIILDEVLAVTAAWWQICDEHARRGGGPDELFETLQRELGLAVPPLRPLSQRARVRLDLLAAWQHLAGIPHRPPGESFVRALVAKLAQGHTTYTAGRSGS